MKKSALFVHLLLFLFATTVYGGTPGVPSTNVTFNSIDGSSFNVQWIRGDGARRIVVMKKESAVTALPVNSNSYVANATFGLGTALAPGEYVVYDGTGYFFTPTGLDAASTYHVAIFEYNGTGANTQYLTSSFAVGSQSTVSAPTIAATNIAVNNISGTSAQITLSPGNGQSRIIVLREGGAVNATPANYTTYGASSTFGVGAQIGTGNYVVRTGANSVTVSNLKNSTTYHIAVFEYNGSSSPVYQTTGFATGNFTTADRPTVASSNLMFTTIDGNALYFQWTKGNGERRIVVVKEGSAVTALPQDGSEYNFSDDFLAAPSLAPGEKIVYIGSNNYALVKNLNHSTTYHFRIYEFDGTQGGTRYLTSSFLQANKMTASAPTIAASNASCSNIGSGSMQVNWSNGNGSYRIIIAKQGAPVNAQPQTGTKYFSNSSFGAGNDLGGGNFVVFNGNGNGIVINNLLSGTTYYFAIHEYNGNNYPVYTNTSSTSSATTLNRPTIAASGIIFSSVEGGSFRLSWTKGNGSKRIVVLREGSAVSAIPSDGVDYIENSSFPLGQEISAGQRVVYDGEGSSTEITGLNPATTYFARIYEYGGSGASIQYLTASSASSSCATLSSPTQQATNLQISGLTSTAATVSWTRGNGSYILVLAKKSAPVDAVPQNLVSYSHNPLFGLGQQLGTGNFVVYKGYSNSFTLQNLQPGTTYYLAAYELNGYTSPVYLSTSPATTSVSSNSLPVQIASFSGVVKGKNVELRLRTASESNTYYAEVERSVNGQVFIPIGQIMLAGNSMVTKEYFFIDTPGEKGKQYYRLKMVDRDGKTAYSNIVSLSVAAFNEIKLAANPVRGFITVEGLQAPEKTIVLNPEGRQVYSGTLSPSSKTINSSGWQPGVYYVIMLSAKEEKVVLPVTIVR